MNSEWHRRQFLYRSLVGAGGLALMDLLNGELQAAAGPLAPKAGHHPPAPTRLRYKNCRRCHSLFMTYSR